MPLRGEILRLDPREPGPRQQLAVSVDALERDRGHPLLEAAALVVLEARPRDPVAEGQARPELEDPRAFPEDLRLVRDVQEAFLADRGIERARPEGEDLRVGPQETHQGAQADEGGEPGPRRAA